MVRGTIVGMVAVLAVTALAAVASAREGATGTRYEIKSVTATETVTLAGDSQLAGAPAKLKLTLVVSWKAGPARSGYGIATLSRDPEPGLNRLCASNTCPTYGPTVGTAKVTGTLTPVGGGKAVTCAASGSIEKIFGAGASGLFGRLEIYKKGARRLLSVTTSQYSYLLQSIVPDPGCRAVFELTAGYRSEVTVPFPVSKLGGATLTLPFSGKQAVSAASPTVVKGTVSVKGTATLVRR